MAKITLPKATLWFSINKWLDWEYRSVGESFKKSFPPEKLMEQYLWVVDIDGEEISFEEGEQFTSLQGSGPEGTRSLTISRTWCASLSEFKPYTGPKPIPQVAIEEMYEDYKQWSGNQWGGGDIEDDIDNIIRREKPVRSKKSESGNGFNNYRSTKNKTGKEFSMRDYIYGEPVKPDWYDSGSNKNISTIDGRIRETVSDLSFFDEKDLPF